MRGFFSRMNPTLRGFLILALVALVIVVLQLEQTLAALMILAQVGFLLAIAFFVYLVWRERRGEIATWPRVAIAGFYGAALLALADVGAYWYGGAHGLQVVAFLAVLAACFFSMWRIWRDQHTFG